MDDIFAKTNGLETTKVTAVGTTKAGDEEKLNVLKGIGQI